MKLSSFYLSCSWFLLCKYFLGFLKRLHLLSQPCSFVLLLPYWRVLLRPLLFLTERAAMLLLLRIVIAMWLINVEYSVLMSAVVYCLGTFYSNVVLHPCLVHVDIKNFNLIDFRNWNENKELIFELKCKDLKTRDKSWKN